MDRVRFYTLPDQYTSDERGWAFFPFQANLDRDPWIHLPSLHMVQVNPGMIRGNHFHSGTAEWLYAFGGKYQFYWEETGQVKSTIFDKDDHVIYIPQGVAHALKNTGDAPIYVMAFREVDVPGQHSTPKTVI